MILFPRPIFLLRISSSIAICLPNSYWPWGVGRGALGVGPRDSLCGVNSALSLCSPSGSQDFASLFLCFPDSSSAPSWGLNSSSYFFQQTFLIAPTPSGNFFLGYYVWLSLYHDSASFPYFLMVRQHISKPVNDSRLGVFL